MFVQLKGTAYIPDGKIDQLTKDIRNLILNFSKENGLDLIIRNPEMSANFISYILDKVKEDKNHRTERR